MARRFGENAPVAKEKVEGIYRRADKVIVDQDKVENVSI